MSARDEAKLIVICESEGFNSFAELFEHCTFGECLAICMNDGCDYITEMEPDQDQGWCEECGTNTVKSALILGGLI